MSSLVVRGPATIDGRLTVPGDKSISHRALLIGTVAHGTTTIRNIGPGEDLVSTIRCARAYGVAVDRAGDDVIVHGGGLGSWSAPTAVLDCGNSGTTMRLLAGLAGHHEFVSDLDGDTSLRPRPMQRLVAPLGALGVRVTTTDGHAPIHVEGGHLSGADVTLDVPSAQVKTAVLFAAMAADGPTALTEPAPSRDHTERLLRALGATLAEQTDDDGSHRVELRPFEPPAFELDVPGDLSSAAFAVGAALLCGRVFIDGVGLNVTRCGFLDAFSQMRGHIHTSVTHEALGEDVGTIEAERSELEGAVIDGGDPGLQDELPLLAVLATQADGVTEVRGAEELRGKESDRIATIVRGLRSLGAEIDELPDGFTVRGPTQLIGSTVQSAGDHRIAMALAVAGLAAKGDTIIEGFDAAAVSWPGFDRALASLGADVELR